ncbi:MAG: hypothetical protein ACLU5J_06725 [Christensenellales bacterium]
MDKVIDSIIDKFGLKVVPFVIPMGKENDYQGYIGYYQEKGLFR